jgi:hypothetical protein
MIVACPDCGTVRQLPPPRSGSNLVRLHRDHMPECVRARQVGWSLAQAAISLVGPFPVRLATLWRSPIGEVVRSSRLSTVCLLGEPLGVRAAGAPAFLAVIVVTMPAVHCLGPLLRWDAIA